jgi:anti-sigma factor RsiW
VHLDDDAELYALGLLEAERTAAIEAHLALCDACRARVVAAEAAAASLAAALPPMPELVEARPAAGAATTAALASPPALTLVPARVTALRRGWSALAVAAALVFAATAAVEGVAVHAAAARQAATDTALLAIAGSHFNHVTLSGEPGVVAKALYARDGAWCYVVVQGAAPGAHVVLRTGTAAHDAGALQGTAPATVFVREPGRVGEIDVVAGSRVIAHAVPAY